MVHPRNGCAALIGTALLVSGCAHSGWSDSTTPQLRPKPEPLSSIYTSTWSAPPMYPTTPIVGSPQWKIEQVENEQRERRLAAIINNICRGCDAEERPILDAARNIKSPDPSELVGALPERAPR
jgi:hypothetical protein